MAEAEDDRHLLVSSHQLPDLSEIRIVKPRLAAGMFGHQYNFVSSYNQS